MQKSLVWTLLAVSLGCGSSQRSSSEPKEPPHQAAAIAPFVNNAKGTGLESDEHPKFPLTAKTGHRTDDDKVDSYVEVTVNGDGSWGAFMHTNATGHVFGGCARYVVLFYGGNGEQLYGRELANFCCGTKDDVFGPGDRQDRVSGPPGDIPPDALAATRKWAVVAESGEHPSAWPQIFEAAREIAQLVELIAAAAG